MEDLNIRGRNSPSQWTYTATPIQTIRVSIFRNESNIRPPQIPSLQSGGGGRASKFTVFEDFGINLWMAHHIFKRDNFFFFFK